MYFSKNLQTQHFVDSVFDAFFDYFRLVGAYMFFQFSINSIILLV